jgi:prepilin-type N-terminal cleavage/methylation domain-containing protein
MRPQKNALMDRLGNEAGFTLLEIIAVIVILSILGVVAVPKYFDLQEKAREKAIGAALAEGIGRVNGHFASQVLDGIRPADIVYSAATLGDDLGDFTLSVVEGTDPNDGTPNLTITVAGKPDSPIGTISDTRTIPKPGGL